MKVCLNKDCSITWGEGNLRFPQIIYYLRYYLIFNIKKAVVIRTNISFVIVYLSP